MVEELPRLLGGVDAPDAVFRIDGKETYRIRGGISTDHQYPILSILASDYEIPKMKDSRLPQQMFVDWVRVWETGP